MNKKVLTCAIVAIAFVGASSYASPYWTIYQMRSAIEKRDSDKFSSYVDFPALRESLKAQLLLSLQDKMEGPDMKENPFAGLGHMIGLAMVNTLVDTMVSPAGVMALMAGEKPATESSPKPGQSPAPAADGAREEAAKDALEYDVSYEGWDMVRATATKENGESIAADYRREGLWSWKWVGIQLPELAK
ncbi:DUF2939 domain-containing protein [Paracidovorax citrulli]